MSPEEQTALEGILGRQFDLGEVELLTPCFGHEMRNDVEITAILGRIRTRVVPTLVGEGTVSNAIGPVAGPVFMRALRLIASTDLPPDATNEQIAQQATLEEAWRHLQAGTLDLGLPSVQDRINSLAGVLPLTQEQADAVKALAIKPWPPNLREVSWALNDAMGIPQE